jgi:hypothetical protein
MERGSDMNDEEFKKQFDIRYQKAETWFDKALRWLADQAATCVVGGIILILAIYGLVRLIW